MGKNIFEEGPRKGHAAGDTSVEQQASQLASDIKYKARQKMKGKSGSNMSPGQVQQLYRSLLGASPAPGAVKAIVKKKLFGEQVDLGIVPVSEHVKSSSSDVIGRVFLEADEPRTVRVTDRATRNTRYVKADRAKVAELRKNTNIASVEYTGRKADPTDAEKASGGKKAKKDYDGDGKIESGTDEYMGSRDKAIKKAMAARRTRKEEIETVDEAFPRVKGTLNPWEDPKTGKSTVKVVKDKNVKGGTKEVKASKLQSEEIIYETDENGEKEKKFDVMKGKNKVIINPKLGEQAEVTAKPSAEDKKQIEMKKRMLQKKMMLQKQAMQMQKQGKLALNYNEETGKVCPKCGKSPCECEKKDADPRGNYAMINVTRNKLRAMGLKMSYDMEGESIDEVTYPSDFIDKRTGKKKSVATSKTGRPQQHDQPMSGGRRKTVDEKYQGMYQSPAPTHNRLKSSDEKARMSPGRRAMAKSDELEKSEPGSKRAKAQKKAAGQIARNFQSARMTKEETEDSLRDRRQERGGVDGNTRYDRPPARKATNKELGIRDFTPAEKEKRAKEIAAHLKKMRR